MIYGQPAYDEPIDQGDLINNCPVLHIRTFSPGLAQPENIAISTRRVLVLTQTCDLANEKTTSACVAKVLDAQFLIDNGMLKTAEIKGPVRAGCVWGWYFLPADARVGLPEMIVDLRRLHTLGIDLLCSLCLAGQRRARVRPLYREHLAKHFADTFSRIGLPQSYETM